MVVNVKNWQEESIAINEFHSLLTVQFVREHFGELSNLLAHLHVALSFEEDTSKELQKHG